MHTSATERAPVLVITASNRFARLLWNIVYACLYRPSPVLCHGWRRFLLRCFGATIEAGAHPYPGCRVWAPWNLTMRRDSCMANFVDCYCVAPISIGSGAVVSQYAYLCTGGHDYEDPAFPLVAEPICIGAQAWVAAGAFVGPGVRIGDGAVIGARTTVVKDVPERAVVVGERARIVRTRNHL